MGRNRDTCNVPGCSKDEKPCLVTGPKIVSFKLPNPALFSSWVQTVTSNLAWTVQSFQTLKTDGLNCSSLLVEHKPMVSPLPVPYLALNNLIFPVPSSTSSVQVCQKAVSSIPQDHFSKGNAVNEKGEVSSTGPAFIGQVYTMCDASRQGLIAVRPSDVLKKIKVPPYMKLMEKAYERAMNVLFTDDMKGPVFRFYFNKDDAAEYVRRLNITGSAVGPCSLDAAYKYYKSKEGMFKFIADQRQVKVAKELVRRERGDKAANKLKGVPVFTARNLTIALSTPQGVRWFRPYFFNKKQLDSLIGHSVDHYYEMLISARRAQRYSQIAENNGDAFAGGESMDDELDGLMDPPEVQELMEELGQGGGGMEFVGLKVLEAQFMDLADRVLLGHQWSRRMIHLQPRFPVIVDSFERLISASELDHSSESEGSVTSSRNSFAKKEGTQEKSQRGQGDEGMSISGRDERSASNDSSESVSKEYSQSSPNSLFNLFKKKWGANANLVFKRKDSGNAEILEEDSDSEYLQETAQKDPPGKIPFQPKLTMMGISMNVNKVEGGLQQAMAAAAKDVEDRLRKGEGSGPDHGPLFIANLGSGIPQWGRPVSASSGVLDDDAE